MRAFLRRRTGADRVHCLRMSGWGCRHQVDEQCLLLRKECKPGMPGCVLYRKVTFLKDVEQRPKQRPKPKPAAKPRKSKR
jgi:hypothetical protein